MACEPVRIAAGGLGRHWVAVQLSLALHKGARSWSSPSPLVSTGTLLLWKSMALCTRGPTPRGLPALAQSSSSLTS